MVLGEASPDDSGMRGGSEAYGDILWSTYTSGRVPLRRLRWCTSFVTKLASCSGTLSSSGRSSFSSSSALFVLVVLLKVVAKGDCAAAKPIGK